VGGAEIEMLALIAAYAQNRVIGYLGAIPWRVKGEQKRFRELTMGNVVVMGRRSYEEIGHPLPNRTIIVMSKTKTFDTENCFTADSLEHAIELAGDRDIYIAGGESLYREALPLADKLYITELALTVKGDTWFPAFDERLFEKEIVGHVEGDVPYTYITYTRKK